MQIPPNESGPLKETQTPPQAAEAGDSEAKLRMVASWVFLLGSSILTTVALGLLLWGSKRDPDFYAVAIRHFPTVVGLPFAAIAALFIVTACRVVVGDKLNFKMLGLEFSGAGGPVALWV